MTVDDQKDSTVTRESVIETFDKDAWIEDEILGIGYDIMIYKPIFRTQELLSYSHGLLSL